MEAKMLSSAKIGKTHGVDGYLKIYSLSGEYDHLKKLKSCSIMLPDGSEKSLEVEFFSTQDKQAYIRFKGYETPEKARRLTNGIIRIPREFGPKLKKGEFYIADLYQMDVISNGEKVATVVSTMEGPQSMLLEVERVEDKKRFLIPYLPVYVDNVNIKENTLELLMPELLT